MQYSNAILNEIEVGFQYHKKVKHGFFYILTLSQSVSCGFKIGFEFFSFTIIFFLFFSFTIPYSNFHIFNHLAKRIPPLLEHNNFN